MCYLFEKQDQLPCQRCSHSRPKAMPKNEILSTYMLAHNSLLRISLLTKDL
ncbi:hypothetical protein FOFC_03024 [Fusarium oxysporum]|nr:hypothetical protein FOFC_03024 [Fusarium oxysporum]